jgi:phosphoglycerol transferase MdoB-like AlkP superfamily enzyme
LASVLALSVCCGGGPTPPYTQAFTFSGRIPRLLWTAEETIVPLNISNTGSHAWDPTRVHVSYHWLWVVPRELASRSRTLPYHDGIRTELEKVVAPGRAVTAQTRLMAPSFPGVYWLQWDMVEEGVTWFAQVSPRQARQLVVVLPTLPALVAPLPLFAVLLGLVSCRLVSRGSRSAIVVSAAVLADVIWCSSVFLAKPLVLAREILLEPTAVAYGLIVVIAVAPPLMALTILPRRIRPWALAVCAMLGTFVLLGDLIYYRFFGDVLSASALFAIGQTGKVWRSIQSLLTRDMTWLVVDLPLAAWLLVSMSRLPDAVLGPTRRNRPVAAAAVVAILAAAGFPSARLLRAGQLEQMFRDRAVMEQIGPFGYHAYDAWNYARSTVFRPTVTTDEIVQARGWFAARAPLRAGIGPYFGAAAGKNLIVIQVESLQEFAVDYRINGQEVMPYLHRWAESGLRFNNVTDETNEGRTSDAEFAALVSLLPLDHGAAAFLYSANHRVGLPHVLGEHGYATLSAVPFEPGFWNRRVMHPSYGFQQSLFETDFRLTEQIGWGLNDRDFLAQMVPKLAALPRPFAAWLITLSLHHPFDDFPDRHKVLKLGALDRTPFGNYLHTMRFFDQALEDFEQSLIKTGLLDETVLVVFGDHDAGFQREPAMATRLGIDSNAASWELNDRVPFLLRLPTHTYVRPSGVRSIAAGQIDFAPTLLALLGIDPAPLPYGGRNLLGTPGASPVPRPYGAWLDGTHLFVGREVHDRGRSCFALASAAFVDDSGCHAPTGVARYARDVLQLVVTGDLQQNLREALR